MTEIFLKAVSMTRNLGYSLDGMTTASLVSGSNTAAASTSSSARVGRELPSPDTLNY